MFGGTDAYAEIYWNDQLLGKTPVADDSQTPVWNCSFRVDVFEVCTALSGPHNVPRCEAALCAESAGR